MRVWCWRVPLRGLAARLQKGRGRFIPPSPCRYFQFVRTNLHVVLLLGGPEVPALPPVTATMLSQLLCSLEVYKAWSYSSLLEVASKRLMGNPDTSSLLTQGGCHRPWQSSLDGAPSLRAPCKLSSLGENSLLGSWFEVSTAPRLFFAPSSVAFVPVVGLVSPSLSLCPARDPRRILPSPLASLTWLACSLPAQAPLHSHKELVSRLAKAAAWIHSSAIIYATYLAPSLPLITPRSFLDFLDSFVLLLCTRNEQTTKHIDRLVWLLPLRYPARLQSLRVSEQQLGSHRLLQARLPLGVLACATPACGGWGEGG